MAARKLLVGLDLGNEFTQVAVYNNMTFVPDLIGISEANEEGLIPTVIELEGSEPVTGFVERIYRGEDVYAGGKKAGPSNLLAYYIRKILTLVKGVYPRDAIKQLVITVEDSKRDFVEIIYRALAKIGIEKDRAMIVSHKQSYLYYAICQKKELWLNDVGMFDYGKNGLTYYQMNIDRRKTPILVGVIKKDFTEAMKVVEEDNLLNVADRGSVFENVARNALHRQIISTLYMTGAGFDGDWCSEAMQKLCVGRRVFKGKNLYVSGACYAARELSGEGKLDDFVFLDEDMIHCHITSKVYMDGAMRDVIFAKAGTPWYQIEREFDLIPDEETEICISVKDILKRENKDYFIPLEGTEGRPNKMTRIGIKIQFADVDTCILTFRDKGFGDFSPSSNRIWEKVIEI